MEASLKSLPPRRFVVATRAQADVHPSGEAIALDPWLAELALVAHIEMPPPDRASELLAWLCALRLQNLPLSLSHRQAEEAAPAVIETFENVLAQGCVVSRARALKHLAEGLRALPRPAAERLLPVTLQYVHAVQDHVVPVLVALEQTLNLHGEGLEIRLPLLEYPTIEERARDPFERLADDWTRALEIAPTFDMAGHAEDAFEQCTVLRVQSLIDSARATREQVVRWLNEGIALDQILVVVPSLQSTTLPLLLELLHDLPCADPRGTPVRGSETCRVVLGVLRSLLPTGIAGDLAELLRSHVVGTAFDTRPMVLSAIRASRAVIGSPLQTLARKTEAPCTRLEFVQWVRDAIEVLGLARRVDLGALHTFRKDGKLTALERAELDVLVQESRAFRALQEALSGIEHATRRLKLERETLPLRIHLQELELSIPEYVRLPVASEGATLRIVSADVALGLEATHVVLVDAAVETLRSEQDAEAFADARLVSALTLCHAAERALLVSLDTTETVHPLVPTGPTRYRFRPERGAPDPRATREQAREGFFMNEKRSEGAAVPSPRIQPWLQAPLSVTHAERYVQCAFRGLASHVFRGKDIESEEHFATALEEGTALHSLLAEVFVAFRSDLRTRTHSSEVLQERAAAFLEKRVHAANVVSPEFGQGALSSVQKRELVDTALAIFSQALADETWTFDAAEVPFGVGQVHAEIQLGAFVLEGRVDRIDRSGDQLRVVDYKLRNVPEKRHLGERSVQVPIYMHALSVSGRPASGAYLARNKLRELGPGETVDASLEAVTSALVRVSAGDIAPRPVHPDVCTSCSLDGVCRKPLFAVEEDE